MSNTRASWYLVKNENSSLSVSLNRSLVFKWKTIPSKKEKRKEKMKS